eukprot:335298-Chlamydomonas_euryale.AAC.3
MGETASEQQGCPSPALGTGCRCGDLEADLAVGGHRRLSANATAAAAAAATAAAASDATAAAGAAATAAFFMSRPQLPPAAAACVYAWFCSLRIPWLTSHSELAAGVVAGGVSALGGGV